MSCEHHVHRVKWRLRCCRCSAEFIIGHGWTVSKRPLKAAKCGGKAA